MQLSLRTKQVLGVTALVGVIVIGLSVQGLAALARVRLEESEARGKLLAYTIYQRARVVAPSATDPYRALQEDDGLRTILESSIYSDGVTYAAITKPDGEVVAHYDTVQIGRTLPDAPQLSELLAKSDLAQLQTIFQEEGRNYEIRDPLELGGDFGSIRVGVSTLLIRDELTELAAPALQTAGGLLLGSTIVALLLAQWLLRPIHVLRSRLQRIESGDAGALDLPEDEFGDLGREITAISERLLAERAVPAGPDSGLDSVVEHLEDAVGIFTPDGHPMFVNPKLRALLDAVPGNREGPFDALVARTREAGVSSAQAAMRLPGVDGSDGGEWLVDAHPVKGRDKQVLGVMVVARDLDRLGEVESTLRYSRKLAALGRLTAGVAHEVKNPLNAMTIHLELLKGKLAAPAGSAGGDGAPALAAAMEHVQVISSEIRRLDQVVQGFLKFMRPEDLRLRPVAVSELLAGVARTVTPDASAAGIKVVVECPPDLPPISGDADPLSQALLNLAINACHAMPNGGTLRLTARSRPHRRVELQVQDTGIGIPPDQLPRIFDLYYTTKPEGSGIGLSMVFRTVQLHDGEVEVQSTPGSGTRFQIVLPQATAGSVLGLA